MRIKIVLAIAVGLLLCSIGTLELPELVNLSDNTSNDFSLRLSGDCTTIVAKKKQTAHSQNDVVRVVSSLLYSAMPTASRRSVSLPATDDLLQMLRIHRT
jgi:hypothetical protein